MAWLDGTPPSGIPTAARIAAVGAIAAAQEVVAAYLAAWLPLAALAAKSRCITWQDKGTVDQDITEAMKATGLSVMVIFRGGTRKSAMKNALLFQPARFEVSIIERPKLNRAAAGTGLSASLIAEEVCKALAGMPLSQGCCEIGDLVAREAANMPDAQHLIVPFESAILIA